MSAIALQKVRKLAFQRKEIPDALYTQAFRECWTPSAPASPFDADYQAHNSIRIAELEGEIRRARRSAR